MRTYNQHEYESTDRQRALADGGVEGATLTRFQLEILYVLADGADYGLGIKSSLEQFYGKPIGHGQVYPNLDTLAEQGLIDVRAIDQRTNEYFLTDDGWRLLANDALRRARALGSDVEPTDLFSGNAAAGGDDVDEELVTDGGQSVDEGQDECRHVGCSREPWENGLCKKHVADPDTPGGLLPDGGRDLPTQANPKHAAMVEPEIRWYNPETGAAYWSRPTGVAALLDAGASITAPERVGRASAVEIYATGGQWHGRLTRTYLDPRTGPQGEIRLLGLKEATRGASFDEHAAAVEWAENECSAFANAERRDVIEWYRERYTGTSQADSDTPDVMTDGGRDQEPETVWITAHADRRAFHTEESCQSFQDIKHPIEVDRADVEVPKCKRCQAIENGDDPMEETARKAGPKKGTGAYILDQMTVEEFDRRVLGRGSQA